MPVWQKENDGAAVDAMKIYLFRHGETDWNKERRLQGHSDIPLNTYGRELAVKTAEALRNEGVSFDRAFCSPLNRAEETAEIILGEEALKQVTLIRDPRLEEIHFGEYEGQAFDEMKSNESHPLHNFFCKPEDYIPPAGAESFQETRERGAAFLKERILPLEGICENVLIIAHGAFNRSILSIIEELPPEKFWQIALPNCAASILQLEKGKFTVLEEGKVYYGNPVNGRP